MNTVCVVVVGEVEVVVVAVHRALCKSSERLSWPLELVYANTCVTINPVSGHKHYSMSALCRTFRLWTILKHHSQVVGVLTLLL